jgi:hypothetical protein
LLLLSAMEFIPKSCDWSILLNSYDVLTLLYILTFFRLKCKWWKLRLGIVDSVKYWHTILSSRSLQTLLYFLS